VIHHGIDVDTFPAGNGAGGYLAMLTRMTPDKGIERAMRLARAAGVPLRIAAKIREQREHDYFENVIAPLLGSTVEFLGEVDAAGKRELLADAAGLLNPIEWDEPFGMAMIESLACGTPVVATPKGAAPEIVSSGTGFLADDDAGLIDAIGRLGEIDRDACREHIRRSFSIESMCERYVTVFEREITFREPRVAAV
jgi:glycosyltransferase involved in cell wall biosynthesis